MQPSEWTRILAKYREPILSRSIFELVVTLGPFVALWGLACWLLTVSIWLALAVAVLNGPFLVRVFLIQHDCGHSAFFKNKTIGDWVGRALGVLTLTPYDVWRKTHAIHHSGTGNLDRRGTGDIPTLTVEEYRNRSWLGRALYRITRNPLFLFGIVPFYIYFLQNRLPVGLMSQGSQYWVSAIGTNAVLGAILGLLYWLGGWNVLLFVFFPTTLVAASIGMWLFYVQHQFEHTSWEQEEAWNIQTAAMHGSSYYVLPGPLRWVTANIGVHHVHHLASRIPFYRLDEVLRDHDVLTQCQRITFWEGFKCARLHLWDEGSQRLLSFRDAKALPA